MNSDRRDLFSSLSDAGAEYLHERFTWAELLRRVYALDHLVCDACGARRKLLSFLTAPESIQRIFEHLGLPTRPPPIRAAPAMLFEFN